MPKTLKIAVAQPMVVPGDLDENIRRMEPLVAEAKRRGAELALFSESGLTGYDWFRRGWHAAVPADSPKLDPVNQMAKKYDLVIVNGFHERAGEIVYNAAAAFFPDGSRVHQRKHNVQKSEDDMGPIPRADRARTPIHVNGFKLAILICADNGIDGIYEELSSQGYDAVLAPTAGLGHSKFAFHQQELSDPARLAEYAKAAESVCFLKGATERAVTLDMGMACCNQMGYSKEMQYFHCGHAGVVDRTGETTALIPGRFIAEHLRPDVNVGFVTKRA